MKISALGAAATMIPAGLASAAPAARKKTAAASDKIRMGFIGLGQQGHYLWGSFIKMDDVRLGNATYIAHVDGLRQNDFAVVQDQHLVVGLSP